MRIILRQDLDELGLEGDIVDVTKGYGRNYLIPKGIGLEASPQNIKALELQSKKIEVRRVKAREAAEKIKQEVEGTVITLLQKSGEEGKLYGSVTRMDIASGLEKQGVVIDRRKILLEKPIKSLGEFEVPVKIYPEVTALIRVIVEPAEEKEG
ncbi:MAG: 50S ribosomal protein L9 [Desulfobacteraceae bacterium 4484_190.2]|nr:MAG: 50S ribosomal protein L9 [Desulfobacteraceae bacterium 4484_190.2]